MDIFYLHAPDHATPLEETLQGVQLLYEGQFHQGDTLLHLYRALCNYSLSNVLVPYFHFNVVDVSYRGKVQGAWLVQLCCLGSS